MKWSVILLSTNLASTYIEEIGFKILDGKYLTFLVNVQRLLSLLLTGFIHANNFNFGAAVVLVFLVGALYPIGAVIHQLAFAIPFGGDALGRYSSFYDKLNG